MKRRRALLLPLFVVLALCAACGVWLHRERQQYALNRQLIAALEHDDTKAALVLVNAGADPNTDYASPSTPSVELLLDHLLHRKSVPTTGSLTAFLMACGRGPDLTSNAPILLPPVPEDLPLLTAMLAHGADVHARALNHKTPLHYAVNGRLHTVELLLQHGADINAQDKAGKTPLMLAVYYPPATMMRPLLAHGANPNVQSGYGNTALHYAIMFPVATSVIPELLAHGADLNLRNKNGLTPLQLAQKAKRHDLVLLLKRGTK